MSSYRSGEIYVSRAIISALHTVKAENETIELLAEKYLTKCLSTDFPGIFDLVEEFNTEIEAAKQKNKARLDEWRRAVKQIP